MSEETNENVEQKNKQISVVNLVLNTENNTENTEIRGIVHHYDFITIFFSGQNDKDLCCRRQGLQHWQSILNLERNASNTSVDFQK